MKRELPDVKELKRERTERAVGCEPQTRRIPWDEIALVHECRSAPVALSKRDGKNECPSGAAFVHSRVAR
jgi:hypothetical protein